MDSSSTKIYDSIFVPNLKVDLANYITEIIFDKHLAYKKINRPGFPFWQKEYKDKIPWMTEEYVYELTQVKKLLKVFSGPVLIAYFKAGIIYTFRYMTKEASKDMTFDLFKLQIKHITDLGIQKNQLELANNKVEYIEQAPVVLKKNKISKGL